MHVHMDACFICMHQITHFSQLSTEGSQLFLVTELVTRRGRRERRVGTIMVWLLGQNTDRTRKVTGFL